MADWYSKLRSVMFRMDPESAHRLAFKSLKSGLIRQRVPDCPRSVMGIDFPNPVGLAAGFDKNAELIDVWPRLGFGFVEIGTVTQHAQPGNPAPRLFRLPEHEAIINRMGFNNAGADEVAKNLERGCSVPLGVNIGKSKVTPLEKAHEDYAYSYQRLLPYADYVVVNVSSPNTPGLRELQEGNALRRILWSLLEIDSSKPLLVKVAPDLAPEALMEVAQIVTEMDLAGMVATNTTISRPAVAGAKHADEAGGLSGAPVRELANEAIRVIREALPADKVLIGVGGVITGADAREKIDLGCQLVQIWTGFIYRGPALVKDAVEAIIPG